MSIWGSKAPPYISQFVLSTMTTPSLSSRQFYGAGREGDRPLGKHFCVVHADPYSPREMRVEIHFSDEEETARTPRSEEPPADLTLVIEGPDVVIDASNVGATSDRDGLRVRADIDQIHERREHSNGKPSGYRFGYRFPLTSLTSDVPLTTRHGRAGFLRGAVNETDGAVSVEPPPMIEVDLDGTRVEIGSTLDFYSSADPRYPTEHVVSESVLGFELLPSVATPVESEARRLAEAVLRLVSVVERDRIQWTRENYFAKGSDGRALFDSKLVRWAPPPRNRARQRQPRHHAAALRALVAAYDQADSELRAEVDWACDQFEIAATAGDIETSLVR